jgi:hypothetical protein
MDIKPRLSLNDIREFSYYLRKEIDTLDISPYNWVCIEPLFIGNLQLGYFETLPKEFHDTPYYAVYITIMEPRYCDEYGWFIDTFDEDEFEEYSANLEDDEPLLSYRDILLVGVLSEEQLEKAFNITNADKIYHTLAGIDLESTFLFKLI